MFRLRRRLNALQGHAHSAMSQAQQMMSSMEAKVTALLKDISTAIWRLTELAAQALLAFHDFIADIHDGMNVDMKIKIDRDGLESLLKGETDELPVRFTFSLDFTADTEVEPEDKYKVIDATHVKFRQTIALNCSACGDVDAICEDFDLNRKCTRAQCPTCNNYFNL